MLLRWAETLAEPGPTLAELGRFIWSTSGPMSPGCRRLPEPALQRHLLGDLQEEHALQVHPLAEGRLPSLEVLHIPREAVDEVPAALPTTALHGLPQQLHDGRRGDQGPACGSGKSGVWQIAHISRSFKAAGSALGRVKVDDPRRFEVRPCIDLADIRQRFRSCRLCRWRVAINIRRRLDALLAPGVVFNRHSGLGSTNFGPHSRFGEVPPFRSRLRPDLGNIWLNLGRSAKPGRLPPCGLPLSMTQRYADTCGLCTLARLSGST